MPESLTFRIEEELAQRLEEYCRETPDYSRSSTLNEALRLYLDIQEIPEEDYEAIRAMIARHKKVLAGDK